MAIEKNSFKVARLEPEYHSPNSKDVLMSSEDEDFLQRNSVSGVESDGEDDEFDDCDSGAGSDDFDLLELGETGEEFCQVGDQTCSIPYELYDLPGLKDVLSMEVWNDVITEEERFGLAKYLPDMDQENFVCTLKELFSGDNLHFGNPVGKLFETLKGGLCEPRVALYRQGLNFFQRRKHYHNLRKHHNAMVNSVSQVRDAWMNCKGYSIEEKLQVLNIIKNQKSLMNENMEEFGSESSDREESVDGLWGKKVKDPRLDKRAGFSGNSVDMITHGRKTATDSLKHGKQNRRVEMKSGRYGLGLPLSRYDDRVGHDSSAAVRMKSHKRIIEDEEDAMYEVAVQKDRNYPRVGAKDNHGGFKYGKKREGPKDEEYVRSFKGMPISGRNNLHALSTNKAINQLSDITVLTSKPSHLRTIYNGGDKIKYTENFQPFTAENNLKSGKGQKTKFSNGHQIELLDESGPASLGEQYGRKNLKIGMDAVDLGVNDKLLNIEYRTKPSKVSLLQIRRRDGLGGIKMLGRSEDTESDSSGQMDEDTDENPLLRSKLAYPGGVRDMKYGSEMKKVKLSKTNKKDSYTNLDGSTHSSRKMEDYSENVEITKAERKGKMHDVDSLNVLPNDLDETSFPGSAHVTGIDTRRQFFPMGRNGHAERFLGDNFQMPSMRSPHNLEGRPRSDIYHDLGVSQANYIQDYTFGNDSFFRRAPPDNRAPFKLGKKGQIVELLPGHYLEGDVPLMGCSTLSKKRKVKDDSAYADAQLRLDDDIGTMRKRGKNKVEDSSDALENGISEPPIMEMEIEEVEPETKPEKKPFPLITPTVHTGFSFSVMHLLSAVRMAMITLLPNDSLAVAKDHDKSDSGEGVKEKHDNKQEDTSVEVNTSTPSAQPNVPSLAVQEIVNRVKSSPGDPCILETQEPLQDLVRGVLKIFSSRTAPLGAKAWKPLVVYEKSTKSWSWIGPVSHKLSDSEAVEEVTSPDAWGFPRKMLVKLVDCYANWFKNSQDTLQQIGSLPTPPLELMQINLDGKDRFKDLRAQKSLSTINPSTEEIRSYFRKEEVLRYLIPDRAFSYTAADGKKSIVAPLRRCGGKPTSKARDHFMLKRDRPPHVTILCLVRDAAARLPGSIGTRADVCTLIRDSQYIVEDVSDTQVNQIVSGALDRLHYERDPCVQFDAERKLWVYLHREREEEDFEDDGTSSTKKWRRPKKEAAEPSDQGGVTVAYPGTMKQLGFDLVSDLNVEASFMDDDKRSEPEYHNGNDQVEENALINHGSDTGVQDAYIPVMWNGDGLNPVEETKLLCLENSTHEDFDEDVFDGEPHV